jgi:hypothetical protein
VGRIIGTTIGLALGFVVFYFPSAYAACNWLWPESNLCGLPAMTIVAPIGAVGGAIAGWRLAGRSEASS